MAGALLGQPPAAFATARALFMSGETRPFACQTLFTLWQRAPGFNESLLLDRLILALNHNNLPLVRYLLTQFHRPHPDENKRLALILKNPAAIRQLPISRFDNALYVFGLEQLVLKKKPFLRPWQEARQRHRLNFAQQQQFIHFVALMHDRQEPDASRWFAHYPRVYTPFTRLAATHRFKSRHGGRSEIISAW